MRRVFVLGLSLGLALLPVGIAHADNGGSRPFIRAHGGDVFAGGWFNGWNGTASTSCSTSDSNYQAPTDYGASNKYKGGILAFGNGRSGSGVDFGALAMGLIQGVTSDQYGFYSGPSAGVNGLSFANSSAYAGNDYQGGYLAGATPQVHCVPDYYDSKQQNPTSMNGSTSFAIGDLSSIQHLDTAIGQVVDITADGGNYTINPGQAITLFVRGNVYIHHDITYGGGATASNVPKLAVVVKGDIYIDPSVTQLSGVYIAQTDGGIGGNIWTCHDGSLAAPDGYWIRDNCGTNTLLVKGSLIAKQLNFMRTNGNTGVGSNPAELIDYTPLMVIGGQFFNQQANTNPVIDSLISLPPIF